MLRSNKPTAILKEGVFSSLIRINLTSKTLPSQRFSPMTCIGIHATPTKACSTHVRLPKLQLHVCSFGGNFTKWTSFWECFQSAVHDNDVLSNTKKFNYLNSLLECAAREAVSGLSIIAANYQTAIETWQRRFGSKQKIVNNHIIMSWTLCYKWKQSFHPTTWV